MHNGYFYKIIRNMNNTAIKIKKRRNELQYSQDYMASQLGISQPAYANLENELNTNRLEKNAKILAVNLIDLLDATTVNNFHNNAENTYGIVENLCQDNKDYAEKIIKQLESDKSQLQNENNRLLGVIES